jgi:hypothetical protein
MEVKILVSIVFSTRLTRLLHYAFIFIGVQ